MGFLVTGGAVLQCSFGNIPSMLMVLPKSQVNCILPVANIMDHLPIVNILPFGMCQSMMNPTVIAATAAAMGVLTPMPCLPSTLSPWTPGCTTCQVGSQPALGDNAQLTCLWGGNIQIKMAGQLQTLIP